MVVAFKGPSKGKMDPSTDISRNESRNVKQGPMAWHRYCYLKYFVSNTYSGKLLKHILGYKCIWIDVKGKRERVNIEFSLKTDHIMLLRVVGKIRLR